jgi:hypothetical protein
MPLFLLSPSRAFPEVLIAVIVIGWTAPVQPYPGYMHILLQRNIMVSKTPADNDSVYFSTGEAHID